MALGCSAWARKASRSAARRSSSAGSARSRDDMVAIAVGIVMHRFSLDRSAALQRLERLARQEGRPLPQSCRAMVEAL